MADPGVGRRFQNGAGVLHRADPAQTAAVTHKGGGGGNFRSPWNLPQTPSCPVRACGVIVEGRLVWRAPIPHHGGNIRQHQKHVGVHCLRQQRSGAVFVDHGFNPLHVACIVADHRNPTAPRTDHANARVKPASGVHSIQEYVAVEEREQHGANQSGTDTNDHRCSVPINLLYSVV